MSAIEGDIRELKEPLSIKEQLDDFLEAERVQGKANAEKEDEKWLIWALICPESIKRKTKEAQRGCEYESLDKMVKLVKERERVNEKPFSKRSQFQ